jgi:dienelactone hydrolase
MLTPDLYGGRTFGDLNDGVRYAQESGFDQIISQGREAAAELPDDLVYAGFSLGVLPAQALAQTRPGARGGIFYQSCLPTAEFGTPWPQGVPVQIHMMDSDPWTTEEDQPAAEALVEEVADAELFLYPGSTHLFADPSLEVYEEQAAILLKERTLAFLDRVGEPKDHNYFPSQRSRRMPGRPTWLAHVGGVAAAGVLDVGSSIITE